MGGKADQFKGRIKEAAGELTDNDRLEREGKLDRATGKVKETAGNLKDKVEDAADAVKEKVSGAFDKGR